MERLRQLIARLIVWLNVTIGTWAVRPSKADMPPKTATVWCVTRDGTNHCVLLYFIPTALTPVRYHVAAIIETGDHVYAVDAGRAGLVMPLDKAPDPMRIFHQLRAKHLVVVTLDQRPLREQPANAVGPNTCAVVAKRLAGVDNPAIWTPEQLLAELWRQRDERSD